jgi:hypothetical protein
MDIIPAHLTYFFCPELFSFSTLLERRNAMSTYGNKKAVASQSNRQSGAPAPLSATLHRGLSSYALAAGAAGVAVLACSASAEAAPVCTNLNLILFGTNTYALNPGSQMIAPFNIVDTFSNPCSNSFGWWNRALFTPNSGGANAVLDTNKFPADLAPGASIGTAARFGRGNSYGLLFTYGYGPSGRGRLKKHHGNFQFDHSNYFGFEFLLSGQVHYGWVRLQVTIGRGTDGLATATHILAYGYESSPNTAIAAGSCAASASNTGEGSTPASLGLLALGSKGVPLWRGQMPQ